MVMNIEVLESWTDYSSAFSAPCPMSSYWIFDGTGNMAINSSSIEAGNMCFRLGNNSSFFPGTTLRMFTAPTNKITLAMGLVYLTIPTPDNSGIPRLFRVVDGSGNTQFCFYLNFVGKLVFEGEGSVVLATSETNLTLSTIYRLCIRAEATAANQVNLSCSINGYDDPGLTKIGLDFQDSAAGTNIFGGFRMTAISAYPGGNAGNVEVLDLVIGTGECVDWGPVEVIEGPPNVDIVKQWTPLSGTDNFAMVDDAQANGDTDYNSTETVGNKDIFGFTDPEIPEYIVALGMVSWEKKEDSATRRYRHILRVAGVDYPGADIYSAESYSRHITAWLENPATTDEWDPTDLAPLEFGYEYLGV